MYTQMCECVYIYSRICVCVYLYTCVYIYRSNVCVCVCVVAYIRSNVLTAAISFRLGFSVFSLALSLAFLRSLYLLSLPRLHIYMPHLCVYIYMYIYIYIYIYIGCTLALSIFHLAALSFIWHFLAGTSEVQ